MADADFELSAAIAVVCIDARAAARQSTHPDMPGLLSLFLSDVDDLREGVRYGDGIVLDDVRNVVWDYPEIFAAGYWQQPQGDRVAAIRTFMAPAQVSA